jgi:ArsR family transcriptional regulator, arsenate/arsenite/antimonite-responsive transcriptional repressor
MEENLSKEKKVGLMRSEDKIHFVFFFLQRNQKQLNYMNMSSYSCCSPDKNEYREVGSLSSLLQLVGENSRLQILCILRQGEHCVCEINEHIKSSQSLISHHLKDLKDGGLIKDNKKGLNVFYFLTPEGKRITDLVFDIFKKEVVGK